MRRAQQLRTRLQGPDMVVAPGAYDGIGARFIEQAGFPAIYMTGAGTSAALGYPDFGLVTMSEMAGNAGNLARSVEIPVIADADTGYGNELNVTRTIQEYEIRNVAALHIEDQVSPKRCGHLDGKEVIPRDEFVAKIRADVDLPAAQAMGYRLAILPSLLIGAAMQAFDQALIALRDTKAPPSSSGSPKVRENFNRMGAEHWDALRTRFRDPPAGEGQVRLPQAAE